MCSLVLRKGFLIQAAILEYIHIYIYIYACVCLCFATPLMILDFWVINYNWRAFIADIFYYEGAKRTKFLFWKTENIYKERINIAVRPNNHLKTKQTKPCSIKFTWNFYRTMLSYEVSEKKNVWNRRSNEP